MLDLDRISKAMTQSACLGESSCDRALHMTSDGMFRQAQLQ